MKKTICLLTILAVFFLATSAIAQPVEVTPALLERSIGLFPELKGPYELRFKDDIRVHELGFQIINYTLMADGNEAGTVTRVTSIINEGVAASVDVLARFDEKGRIKDITSLKPWPEEDKGAGSMLLLSYLKGKDIKEQKDVLLKLATGLAFGMNAKDAKPAMKPPKDKVWDLKGKMLDRGAKLPPLKTKDLNGKEFDTSKVKGKFMVVFTSPSCGPCSDMIKSLGRALDLFEGSKSLTVAYAVAADAPAARDYVKRLGIKGTAIAEPDDHVSKAFMAPFKPYALMFENGKLQYNLLWKEEKQLFGIMFIFINGRPPTQEEVGRLEKKLEAMGLKK